MQSLTSIRASNFLQRCCWGPHMLSFQSTEALNSGSQPSYEGKDGSLADTAKPDVKEKKDVYSEVAADITTTVSDGMGTVTVDRRSKFAFYLPSYVQKRMNFDGFRMQRLPTQRKIPAVILPADLMSAMNVILKGSTKSDLQKQALSLSHKIIDRRVPMERQEWELKQSIFYQGLVDQESVDPMHPNVLEEDRHKLLQNREQAFKRRILAELGNYKPPIDYNAQSGCQLYMHARLPCEFASLVKAFSQLRASLPNFSPSTLLDFGSGVGSVTWAMDRVWPHQCKQTVSIDSSAEMNVLNERLLRGGTDDGPLKQRRQHTFFRQFLPASASVKHNLVVMSRTLFDLTNAEVRLRTLDILWKTVSPGGCLVLVDEGHPQACQLMLEARHFLLETESSKSSNAPRIVAPCPHQFACPLLKKEKKYQICTDSVKFFQYGVTGTASQITFSYMAFYKPTEEESSLCNSDGEQLRAAWPRIVQPVIKHSTVTTVRVCNQFGNFQELAVVKSKHGTLCRRLAKASHLGDLFPVELLQPSTHVTPQTKIFDKIRETRQTLAREKYKDDYITNEEHDETFDLKGKEES